MCIRDRLHIEEPEPPAPVTEPEKTFEEVLDEHPVSIQVNGQWQDVYKRQSWSQGKELKELRASLETINKTSGTLISDIERHYKEICKELSLIHIWFP